LEEFAARLSRAADSLAAGDMRVLGSVGEVDEPAARAPGASGARGFAPHDASLELDLDAAGMDAVPPSLSREPGTTRASARPAPGSGGSGTWSGQPALQVHRPSPAPRPTLLDALLSDRWALGLTCASVGLALGLLPALEVASRRTRDQITPREDELAGVVDRPLAVRAGQARAPSDIVAELESAYASVRRGFATTWLVSGFMVGGLAFVGLGLRRMRRTTVPSTR
jgi:hypothetical protein